MDDLRLVALEILEHCNYPAQSVEFLGAGVDKALRNRAHVNGESESGRLSTGLRPGSGGVFSGHRRWQVDAGPRRPRDVIWVGK